MTIIANQWETQLLHLVAEANPAVSLKKGSLEIHPGMIQSAYLHCANLTKQHSKTFSMAAQILEPNIRGAIHALYAYCRTSDDIVDRSTGNTLVKLNAWKQKSLNLNTTENDPVILAWADTCHRFHIPRRYAEQLIEGVERDLVQSRYETFEELAVYCYGVASTVGLMYMHIVGYESDAAIPYAVKLGVALQMTNILRDIGEDWANGRLYLPQVELAQFQISEEQLAQGLVNRNWRNFMRFQIDRTRQIYAEAWPGIAMLSPHGRLAVAAAATFYRGILDDIEKHDYDVFSRRAHLSGLKKISMLPGIWLKSQIPG